MSRRISAVTLTGITLVSVIAFVSFMHTLPNGDDLAYAGNYIGATPAITTPYEFCRSIWSHWMWANGRLPNYLLGPVLTLPHWLYSLICASFIGGMYLMVIISAGAKAKPLAAAVLSALICFALPWWDSFTLIACQANYVWATVGILASVYIIIYDTHLPMWLAMIIVALGTSAHEAATVSAGAGVVVWFLADKSRFTPRRKLLFFAAIIGAMLPLLSPGIWRRAADDFTPDDPLLLLLIKSDLPAILLLLSVGIAYALPCFRGRVVALFRSQALIYFVAAAVSIVISGNSGIVGRSGWFGSIFAFIFLGLWIERLDVQSVFRYTLSGLLWTAVLAQNVYAAWWQVKLYPQCVDFVEQYRSDPEGIAYIDYTRFDDIPWLTLGKARGVPDPDNRYLYLTMSRFYRTDGRLPRLFPTQLRNEEVTPGTLQNGDLLVPEIPAPCLFTVGEDGDTLYATRIDGRIWVAQPIRGLWHLSPLVLDPGDRHYFTDSKMQSK